MTAPPRSRDKSPRAPSLLLGAAGLAVLALAVWLLGRPSGPPAGATDRITKGAAGPGPAAPSPEGSAARRDSVAGTTTAVAPAPPVTQPPSPPVATPAPAPSPGTPGGGTPVAGSSAGPAPAPPSAARLSKEEIIGAMQAIKPQVKECYETALKRDPSLGGRVVVRLELAAKDGKGHVVHAEVKDSEAASPLFELCLLQKVAEAPLPAPKGEGTVKVTYPFVFDPDTGFGGKAGDTP